jgi:hypothetical protein
MVMGFVALKIVKNSQFYNHDLSEEHANRNASIILYVFSMSYLNFDMPKNTWEGKKLLLFAKLDPTLWKKFTHIET